MCFIKGLKMNCGIKRGKIRKSEKMGVCEDKRRKNVMCKLLK